MKGSYYDMDREREARYFELFEKMINLTTDPANFNREHFVGVLTDIGVLFRLSKGVTEFYKTVSQEKLGDGEVLVDFDTGEDSKIVLQKRFVTKSMAVVKGTLYMAKNESPLPEDEINKLDTLLRALLGFVSRNRLQNAVEQMGFYDENGYPNMRSFKRHLEIINEKNAFSNYTAGCFNLKHLTLINREVGRDKADVAMRKYIELISSLVGNDGIVCRMGGDNFVLIFKNDHEKKITDAFMGAPVAYDETNDKRVMVSATAGFFRIPKGFKYDRMGVIMDRIIPTSMIARQEDKGPIVYFKEDFLNVKEKNMELQVKMSKAISDGEFKVFYQPKVDIRTGNIIGAEALCRWFRDGEIVPPGEFIPFLEQSMEICHLDFHMLDLVCRDIRRWLAAGRKAIKISVNFSRKHLVDADLLDHIMEVIDKHEVPHRYIEIELTETTTDAGFNQLKRVVNGLQNEGIYTAIDDFGVGYSSLHLLREIPWNVLKIDKCFLPGDNEKKSSIANCMYSHVVAMGRDLGLECITEGVETPKQIETMRECKCYFAQGYVFDKPMPVADFEKKLDNPHYDVPTV